MAQVRTLAAGKAKVREEANKFGHALGVWHDKTADPVDPHWNSRCTLCSESAAVALPDGDCSYSSRFKQPCAGSEVAQRTAKRGSC